MPPPANCPLECKSTGWFLIRAVTDVEPTYRFASTGPYYVEFSDSPQHISRQSVQFFLDWLDTLEPLPHDPTALEMAREFWQRRLTSANAP